MPDPTNTENSGTPTSWALRLGYRLTHSEQTTHGIQAVVGPTFRLSENFKLSLGVETNLTFLYSESDPETLGRDGIVGEHFEGVRESEFGGDTFSDVTGGAQYQNNVFGLQMIPELQLMWRPSTDVPFEMGFRAGFIANYSNRHTEVTAESGFNPGDHTGDGCVPGDMYCDEGPIPEPAAGAGYGPFTEDVGRWEFTGRFGPRINFPWADWISTSAELLFIGNNKENGSFDLLFRAGTRFTAPLHDNFQLMAEPRYVLRRSSGENQHGFDLVAGTVFKW